MNRYVTLFGALMCTSLLASGIALAQEQDSPRPTTQTDAPPTTDVATPAPRTFDELDANGDGSIGKDEAAVDPALTQAFGTLDQDADGKLTAAEYGSYKPDKQTVPHR